MSSSYTETYKDLYHGTTVAHAAKIVEMQAFIPSETGWCGAGIYFYDNKSKAWWSATRTCYQEKMNGNTGATPDIVIADLVQLNRSSILDLRSPDDLKKFADFVNEFLSKNDFSIANLSNKEDPVKLKRALLLSYFCNLYSQQLVIGYFRQEPQEKIDNTQHFANAWQLAIGIETIYCAKDPTIVHNIRRR